MPAEVPFWADFEDVLTQLGVVSNNTNAALAAATSAQATASSAEQGAQAALTKATEAESTAGIAADAAHDAWIASQDAASNSVQNAADIAQLQQLVNDLAGDVEQLQDEITDLEGRVVLLEGGSAPDTEPPTLTLLGDNPLMLTLLDAYVEPGATVFDEVDPNPTLIIDHSEVDTTIVGTYSVYYTAADASGNMAFDVREVVVQPLPDTEPPVITLNGPNPQLLVEGDSYVELGASAVDAIDPFPVLNIDSSEVNMAVPGTYSVYYTASDASGNTASTIRVVVVEEDVTLPQPVVQQDIGAAGGPNTAVRSSPPAAVPVGIPPDIFLTERYSSQEYVYDLLPNNRYRISLFLSERYAPNFAVGKRIFHVMIDGVAVDTIDIFARVGSDTALQEDYEFVTNSTGTMVLTLVNEVQNAMLNGVQIWHLGAAPPPPVTNYLELSFSPDRANSVPLDGATIEPNQAVYIHYNDLNATPPVTFTVSNGYTRTENFVPFDLGGTGGGNGNAGPYVFDTPGVYTITVRDEVATVYVNDVVPVDPVLRWSTSQTSGYQPLDGTTLPADTPIWFSITNTENPSGTNPLGDLLIIGPDAYWPNGPDGSVSFGPGTYTANVGVDGMAQQSNFSAA